jgi:hypothetical protein
MMNRFRPAFHGISTVVLGLLALTGAARAFGAPEHGAAFAVPLPAFDRLGHRSAASIGMPCRR